LAHDSEANPSRATVGRRTSEAQGGAGLLSAGLAVLVSGFVCWQWLIPALATGAADRPAADASISELAPVDEQDIDGAIGTLGGSPEFLASAKDRGKACPRPLAWVSVMREPGQPAAKVRLRSGNYFSPLFQLTDVPTRIAIPYPAPYDRGAGSLAIVGAGIHAVVALRPAWHVDAQGDGAARNVTWHPVKRCVQPGG